MTHRARPQRKTQPAAALLLAERLPESDPQRRVVVEYKTSFERASNQPVSTFGGHAYDGLMILAEAIRRARKLARKRAQREGLLPSKPRSR